MLLIFALSLLLLWLVWKTKKKTSKLPPGPPRLPLIGSLLHFLLEGEPSKPAIAFHKLAKKYGDVMTIKLGSVTSVVINSHEKIVALGTSDEFLDHNDENENWLSQKSNSVPNGIFLSVGKYWVESRSFAQKIIRNTLYNKGKVEEIIMEETRDFCNWIKNSMVKDELVMRQTTQFNILFFNTIFTLLTGKKREIDDPRSHRLLATVDEFMKTGQFGGSSLPSMFPALISIFPRLMGLQQLQKLGNEFKNLVQEEVDLEREERTFKYEASSVLDEYFRMIAQTPKPSKPLDSIYTDDNLVAVIQDFIIGGTDTQSHLMKFFIRYLLHFPDIQKKLQKEVDEVVGRNRHVTFDDIPSLLYTQATVYELYRMVSVLTLIPRTMMSDYTLGDYEIPKGTLVLFNLWAGNQDSAVWTNPSQFIPERFLTADKTTLINTEKILSFGYGKRRCLGEQLAKSNVVLVAATLIHEFSFHVDPASGLPGDEDIHAFIRDTVPYTVLIKNRI